MCHRTESFWSSNWSFVVRLGARCLNSGWLVATTCLQVGKLTCGLGGGTYWETNLLPKLFVVPFHWVEKRVFASTGCDFHHSQHDGCRYVTGKDFEGHGQLPLKQVLAKLDALVQ